jgi:putative FmdB family regulatory protein
MPTYEYRCSNCENLWEELQKISEPALDTCPKCHEKTAQRLISGGSFILKGGGWYADLYSSSGGAKKSESKPSEGSGSSETKSESTAAPAKTESAAPAATAPSTTPSKT